MMNIVDNRFQNMTIDHDPLQVRPNLISMQKLRDVYT